MKPGETRSPLPLFYSYSHRDEPIRDELEKHLRLLSREGLVSEWYDRQIMPGDKWAQEIDINLEAASIILLLVSPDFLASDYCYDIEMKRALERARDREAIVVPVILRPCDWQNAPFAHLQAVPKGGKPVTSWDNQDEAFLNITQQLRAMIERKRAPERPLPKEQLENRQRLLKRVRSTWIDGLLAQVLKSAPWLVASLQEQPDALSDPWGELVQELAAAPRPYPAGTVIPHIYDEADGRLLILGEPGAGKTMQLLLLARTLLERAESDQHQPLPVVFVLSSWAHKRPPIVTWLVDELKMRYQIPGSIAERLVKERQILPLLDGLDEVAAPAREACAQAINTYIENYLEEKNLPIVVTSRHQEYMALSAKLNLQKAVSVLPFSPGQIEQYLSEAGPGVAALRQALRQDANLAEMARTPLLLNIFTLTYMDSQLGDLPVGLGRDQALTVLFSNYVKRMLNRRGLLRSTNKKQALEWLSFLARQMKRYDQTILGIETIQPDGLSRWQDRGYRIGYALLVGILFILAVGPLTYLAYGFGVWADYQKGTLDPTYFAYLGLFSDGQYALDHKGLLPLSFFLGEALSITVGMFLFVAFLATIIAFFIALNASYSRKDRLEIQPREVLTWDWSRPNIRLALLSGLSAGVGAGLFGAAFFGAFFSLFLITLGAFIAGFSLFRFSSPGSQQRIKNLPRKQLRLVGLALAALFAIIGLVASNDAYSFALGLGIPVAIVVGIVTIATGSRLSRRGDLRPNEGTWRSARNGLLLGLVITVCILLSMELGAILYAPSLYNAWQFLVIGPVVGTILGLFFGLNAFIRHFTLRLVLWLNDHLPWKLADYLDEMTERLFLQRLGGSYLFLHRFLLDFFARLTPVQQASLAAELAPRRVRRVFNKRWGTALVALASLVAIISISTVINTQAQLAANIFFSSDYHLTEANIWEDPLMGDATPAPNATCFEKMDGAHVLSASGDTINVCPYDKNRQFTDLAVEVAHLTISSGNCGGIVMRFNASTGAGYFFYVCHDKTYGLLANLSDQRRVNLIPPTEIPKDIPAASSLSMIAQGSTLTLYLNDFLLARVHDTRYTHGTFALAAWDQQQPTEAVFLLLYAWQVKA